MSIAHRFGSRTARRFLALICLLPAALLLLAMLGQLVRDRTVTFALLMYLPLPAIALLAIVCDFIRCGRSLPRGRFVLTSIAMLAVAWHAISMTGLRRTDAAPPAHPAQLAQPAHQVFKLLQWNVQWGGHSPDDWPRISQRIAQAQPDILLLNEAPSQQRMRELCERLGSSWSFVMHGSDRKGRYWFNLSAASRWPLRVERALVLPNGAAMSIVIDTPQRPMRLLIVDGVSSPLVLRGPMLDAVTAQLEAAMAAGVSIDIIAGDFNALGRSVGFDRFHRRGLTRASDRCSGWRGTYPAHLPLYDIDHVWLDGAWRVQSCRIFTVSGTNHRGQIIELWRPN